MNAAHPLRRFVAMPVAMLLLSSVPAGATEIVAHRGASHDAPENTVRAVRLGWEQKADACEIDIRLSSDGKIVLLHDTDTKRTAGAEHVASKTPLADLVKLDAGSWKGEEFKGELLPSLDDLLKVVPAGERLYIEIKTGAEIMPELER